MITMMQREARAEGFRLTNHLMSLLFLPHSCVSVPFLHHHHCRDPGSGSLIRKIGVCCGGDSADCGSLQTAMLAVCVYVKEDTEQDKRLRQKGSRMRMDEV